MGDLVSALTKVFSNYRYLLITVITSTVVISAAVWLPNYRFLKHTITTRDFTVSQKAVILGSTLNSFQTNFSTTSQVIVIIIALEIGIYLCFSILLLTEKGNILIRPGSGFLGTVASLFGSGCASCGSIVLTAIFGLAAATAFLNGLPFRGQEFGFLAIGLLSYSIFSLARKIRSNSC